MFKRLRSDIKAVFNNDPAARSTLEVLLAYPGLHAIIMHRQSNWLYRHHLILCARLLAEWSRFITGIEIHPAAVIGDRFFIDHGMQVVIGETAVIGNDVLMYQGSTLGGVGTGKGKRHPTIGNNVVIGAGAKVLGDVHIGDNVRVGANSVVVKDVPADTTVVGVPARAVREQGKAVTPLDVLDHGELPDPETEIVKVLVARIERLQERLNKIAPQKKTSAKQKKFEDEMLDWFIGGGGI
ncbi:MAG: serine O-acetyltransferase [Actinomycetota bacterium]